MALTKREQFEQVLLLQMVKHSHLLCRSSTSRAFGAPLVTFAAGQFVSKVLTDQKRVQLQITGQQNQCPWRVQVVSNHF